MAIEYKAVEMLNIKGDNQLIDNVDDQVLQAIQGTLKEVTGDFSDLSVINGRIFANQPYLSVVDLPTFSGYLSGGSFYNCTRLKRINMPLANAPVGAEAFAGCINLEEVNMPNLTVDYYTNFHFKGCEKLKSAYFPKFKNLSGTFDGCKALSSVYLPSVSRVESYAFRGCENMSSVDLPALTAVANYGFAEFTGLKEFYNSRSSLYLGYSGAFASCPNLEKVSITGTASLINRTFADCPKLKEAYLPNAQFGGDSDYKRVFANDTSLEKVDVPLTSYIGHEAFINCINLKSVSAPNARVLFSSCFQNCYALEKLELPRVTTINNSTVFSNCTNLKTIVLSQCGKIWDYAFNRCYNLSVVVLLSQSVVSFLSNAFATTAISNSNYLGYYGSIYVPTSLVDAYKAKPYYSERIASIDDLPEGVLNG